MWHMRSGINVMEYFKPGEYIYALMKKCRHANIALVWATITLHGLSLDLAFFFLQNVAPTFTIP